MQIVLILVVLAAAVLLTLGVVFIGAVVLGGILLATKRARILVPVFFLIVPGTVLGALAGAVIVGYFAVRANENLIFLGPVGGLVAGGIGGLLLGSVGALLWWRRMYRAVRLSPQSHARSETGG